MNLRIALHRKTTLQTTTNITSWRNRTVFENSKAQVAFKRLKYHDTLKPKKRVVPIVTVYANILEISTISGLNPIFCYNQ